ncbi:hypothetical protein [Sphingomonas sp.]|uniref:hypothetical protein n=1 Tax=Sphingomonas sp. TaxID=28214 RepID=UPI003B3ABCA2
MPKPNAHLHARSFNIEGRQILAMLDRDEGGNACLTFRGWSDVVDGPVCWSLRIVADRDAPHDLFLRQCRAMLRDTTEHSVRTALQMGGFFDQLNALEGRNV